MIFALLYFLNVFQVYLQCNYSFKIILINNNNYYKYNFVGSILTSLDINSCKKNMILLKIFKKKFLTHPYKN